MALAMLDLGYLRRRSEAEREATTVGIANGAAAGLHDTACPGFLVRGSTIPLATDGDNTL